jgi:hypothetical protein
MSTDLTELGVAAIREGVAKGDFTAVEVAEAFNANVAAPSSSRRPNGRSKRRARSMRIAPPARRSAAWRACRSA